MKKNMKKNMKKWFNHNLPTKRDKGIALMMTLGVLALLWILAMTFAYTSRIERMAASVNLDIGSSRLLAESGLNRIIGILEDDYDTFVNDFAVGATGSCLEDRRFIFSADTSSPDQTNIETALSVDFGGIYYTPEPSDSAWATLTSSSDLAWDHITTSAQIAGTNETVITGRIAWILFDDTGKLDPTACVADSTAGKAEGLETRTNSLDDLSEINLISVGIAGTNNFDHRLEPLASGDGMPVDGSNNATRWHSYYHMINGVSYMDQTKCDSMLTTLYPFTNLNKQTFDEITYDNTQHCNLASISNGTTISEIINGGGDDATGPIKGIDWLKNNFTGTQQNQIAANIKDYCDEDSIPTTDDSTYCGIEKVPFINE
ncbi:MAG: hypothetical protein U9O87_02370, partial [Verrucomicrobiota bacterium]|nr:hypothetical protein [Verrucomicrobiota bacterium]